MIKFINTLVLTCILVIAGTVKADQDSYVVSSKVYFIPSDGTKAIKVETGLEKYGPFMCWWKTSYNKTKRSVGPEVFCVYRNNITTMYATVARCDSFVPKDTSSGNLSLYHYNKENKHELFGQFVVWCNTTSEKKSVPVQEVLPE